MSYILKNDIYRQLFKNIATSLLSRNVPEKQQLFKRGLTDDQRSGSVENQGDKRKFSSL